MTGPGNPYQAPTAPLASVTAATEPAPRRLRHTVGAVLSASLGGFVLILTVAGLVSLVEASLRFDGFTHRSRTVRMVLSLACFGLGGGLVFAAAGPWLRARSDTALVLDAAGAACVGAAVWVLEH